MTGVQTCALPIFWFGVQSSTDGEFFGAEEQESTCINYYVHDIEKVKDGIEECKRVLGDNLNKLTEFFNSTNGYNYPLIKEFYKTGFNQNINENQIDSWLEWFARLDLGTQILECMERNGSCSFTAET